ncbi:macro domain-containing protein [Aerococcus sp. NPDC058936]|uniref:macro domain-containing protein n=1 Tax=Aerococcus sp. NPDC058936 TaxID=3346674 RepID=UPI0036707890
MDKALKTAIHYLWDQQNDSSHAQKAFTDSLKRTGTVRADGTLNLASITDENDRWAIFRGLVNVRDGYQPSEAYLMAEGSVLQAKLGSAATPVLWQESRHDKQIFLWQGDITRLKVDAIVNAANKDGLGCFIPSHHCIDNTVHTMAGAQVRTDMALALNGRKLPVGKVMVTKAYNLPSAFIFHTVGPVIFREPVSQFNQDLLAACYRNCLVEADKMGLSSIAFCAISTGEFRFPKTLARDIAIRTVRDYLAQTASGLQVLFNVYSAEDLALYEDVLM